MNELLKTLAYRCLPSCVLTPLLKRHYLRKLKGRDKSEEPELGILHWFVRDGDSVIDVGANIGIYTAPLSRLVGPDGIVHSFEPVPRTFELLSYNVRGLQITNVKLFNLGLSDCDRCATLEIPRYASGGCNLYRAYVSQDGSRKGARNVVRAQVKKLDDVLAHEERQIAFIKIDVEGHEREVLEGARNVIIRSMPVIQVEISGDRATMMHHPVFRWLFRSGYRFFRFDGDVLRRVEEDWHKGVNYYLLHETSLTSNGLPDLAVERGSL